MWAGEAGDTQATLNLSCRSTVRRYVVMSPVMKEQCNWSECSGRQTVNFTTQLTVSHFTAAVWRPLSWEQLRRVCQRPSLWSGPQQQQCVGFQIQWLSAYERGRLLKVLMTDGIMRSVWKSVPLLPRSVASGGLTKINKRDHHQLFQWNWVSGMTARGSEHFIDVNDLTVLENTGSADRRR